MIFFWAQKRMKHHEIERFANGFDKYLSEYICEHDLLNMGMNGRDVIFVPNFPYVSTIWEIAISTNWNKAI